MRRRIGGMFLSLFERGVCVALIAVPPVFLAPILWKSFVRRADATLAQSAPVISQEASRALNRSVRIGSLRIGDVDALTLAEAVRLFQTRETLGVLPIRLNDIVVKSGVSPYSETLARAQSAVADVSVPRLLAGDFLSAVPAIRIASPYLLLTRNAGGRFNVLDLVPPPKKGEPTTIFRTVVELSDANVAFRDSAAKLPAARLPERNNFVLPSVRVDLTQTRRILFDVAARGKADSATANRIGGPTSIRGSFGRGTPDGTASSPTPDSAKSIVNIKAANVDLPYWLDYLFDVSGFALTAGRGNADVTIVLPPADVLESLVTQKSPVESAARAGLLVTGEASITNARVVADSVLPAPLTQINGRVQFGERVVLLDVNGNLLGAGLSVSGNLWNLGADADNNSGPQFAATLSAPRLPVPRYARVLFGTGRKFPALPRALRLGDTASINATLQGGVNDPIVSGQISLSSIGWANYPALRDVSGNLAYARGIVGVRGLRGKIGETGRVVGQVAARLAEPAPNGVGIRPLPEVRRAIEFEAQASDLPLRLLSSILPRANRKTPFRVQGRGDTQLVGSLAGTDLSLAANVVTRGLQVDNIPFREAKARIVVENGVATLPFVSIVSPVAGSLRVGGDVDANQRLNLRWAARGIEAGRIATLLGVAGVDGVITGEGQITGTVANPRLDAREIAGLGLRYGNYKSDILSGSFSATPARVTLGPNVRITRFPTVVTVAGSIAEPLSDPRLDLHIEATRVPYNEILTQATDPETANRANITGLVRRASADVRGRVRNPQSLVARGNIVLGQTVIADIPVTRGSLTFDYSQNRATARNISLETPLGNAGGTVSLLGGNRLRGALRVDGLDLAQLPGVPRDVVSLDGVLAARADIGGTITQPTVAVQVTPSAARPVRVAGLTLTDLAVPRLSLAADTRQKNVLRGRVVVPRVSLSLDGNQFTLTNARYDIGTRRLGTGFAANVPSIAGLISTLRGSGLSRTGVGASLLTALNGLPTIDGQVTITDAQLTARAPTPTSGDNNAADGLTDVNASATVLAQNGRIGKITGIRLDARATLRNDTLLSIERFTLANDQTTVLVSGRADLRENGPLDLTLDSNEASLDLVREFVPDLPLSGSVNITATARGTRNAPLVNASLDSGNIVVRTNTAPPVAPAPTDDDTGNRDDRAETNGIAKADAARLAYNYADEANRRAARAAGERTIALDLVRIRASLRPTNEPGEGGIERIIIEDSRVATQGNQIDLSASIPFSLRTGTLPQNLPVRATLTIPPQNVTLLAALVPGLKQKNLPAPKPAPRNDETTNAIADPAPAVALTSETAPIFGELSLGGTLAQPQLSGQLQVKNLVYAVPRTLGQPRDRFNPINDIRATVDFKNDSILLREASFALGGPNGQRGDFGKASATGGVRLRNLQNIFSRGRQEARLQGGAPTLGDINLALTFDNLRLVAEDLLLGGGEILRAKVNGLVTVRGPLEQPTIATDRGVPLRLADMQFTLPRRKIPEREGGGALPINPRFDLRVVTENAATLQSPGTFRFDATGRAELLGSLAEIQARATLITQGGYYQYGLGRFRIQKNGEIGIVASPTRTVATLRDVIGQSIVYSPTGGAPTLTARANRSGVAGSNRPDIGSSSRYKVTIALNGPVTLLGDERQTLGPDGNPVQTLPLTLSSDPPLSREQILALIGTQQQIELAARGQVETALRQGLTQAFTSNVVPGLLSGFEQSVASVFGLEEFGIDYGLLDPNAPLTFNLVKRLPGGLDRFLFSYQRTVSTRSQLGAQQPYIFSLYYDLRELRATRNIRPRLQIGVSQDNQQNTQNFTYFLRGAYFF